MHATNDVLRAEASLRNALLASNAESLNALLSGQLLWVDADSIVASKTDLMTPAMPGRLHVQVLDARPFVKAINEQVAMTVVPSNVAGRLDGEAFEGLFLYTRTWVREDGQWKVQTCMCVPGGLSD